MSQETSRSAALTKQDIRALGEKLRQSPDPIEQRLAFSKLLEGLTQENALLVREQIVHLDHRSAEFREFHFAWGAIAGAEAILAVTPSPPPPNVDPLEPVVGKQPKTTARAKLEAHATEPNCVSCHAKIDPLGFAFENFNATGRWRDTEHVREGIGNDPPVDASGVLPNGKPFGNASEFKRLLAQDDRLAEAFLDHLATYALRRVMTVDDLEHLHAVANTTEHRLQSLIRALVLSEVFALR
jgi:hypothetical protein